MERCDVLIVGGGPAGSSLAWGLGGSGLDVVVMDKKTFPREKICAGWITPAVIAALDLNTEEYRNGRVLEAVQGFRVSVMGRGEIDARYDGPPISYGIRRCEFDHYLLQRSGARLRLGESFVEMRRDGKDWIVNDSIRASLVVGAGGHFCPVARGMKIESAALSDRLVVAQEIEFLMSPKQKANTSVRADLPELYFSEDLKGYSWVFNKGGYLNVGVGREGEHGLTEHVRSVLPWMKRQGKIPMDAPEALKGHAYLLYPHLTRRLLEDGVLLIGDAAGFAYLKSGEGIRPAVESGLLAAGVIKKAGGDYRAPALQAYRERATSRFGPEKRSRDLSDRLPESMRRFLGRRLFANNWFVREVIINRWFLHADQPALKASA